MSTFGAPSHATTLCIVLSFTLKVWKGLDMFAVLITPLKTRKNAEGL